MAPKDAAAKKTAVKKPTVKKKGPTPGIIPPFGE